MMVKCDNECSYCDLVGDFEWTDFDPVAISLSFISETSVNCKV